jgi:hypothetical protein
MTEENTTVDTGININDIAAMLRIIDTAAERGAFRGGELTAVGTVRDKAANFLASLQPAEEEGAEETAAEEEAAEE